MIEENKQQSEHVIWEMNRTMSKLARRKKLIELLKKYNEQDEHRLNELASYN